MPLGRVCENQLGVKLNGTRLKMWLRKVFGLKGDKVTRVEETA
jgi:hypothetical protein